MAARRLVVWDFDWSLVNENSDTYVIHQLDPSGAVWKRARKLHNDGMQWTQLMDWCVGELHAMGHAPSELKRALSTIPCLDGAKRAVYLARETDAEIRILSDANEIYIAWILEAIGLADAISLVTTNPAMIDDTGRLRISPHQIASSPHACPRCPSNLCKGAVLEAWLSEPCFVDSHGGARRPRCVYVGDGGGDFCPATKLAETDAVLARKPPHGELLRKCMHPPKGVTVMAKLYHWSDHEQGASLEHAMRDALSGQSADPDGGNCVASCGASCAGSCKGSCKGACAGSCSTKN